MLARRAILACAPSCIRNASRSDPDYLRLLFRRKTKPKAPLRCTPGIDTKPRASALRIASRAASSVTCRLISKANSSFLDTWCEVRTLARESKGESFQIETVPPAMNPYRTLTHDFLPDGSEPGAVWRRTISNVGSVLRSIGPPIREGHGPTKKARSAPKGGQGKGVCS
jgi:hypothetical protein